MSLSENKQRGLKSRAIRIVLIIVFALVIYSVRQNQQTSPERINTESVEAQKQRINQDFEKTTGLKASSVLKPGPAQEKDQTLDKTSDSLLMEQQAQSSNAKSKSNEPERPGPSSKQTPAKSSRPPPIGKEKNSKSLPELGQLRDLGGKVWESAAGLKYGPGSQEKHRLLHVMKHAEDQPDRPGKHGVFAGEGVRKNVLALIDEAYLKALAGGKSIVKKSEGTRVVYTVDMGRPVGYVGGRVGNQQGKPKAYKIRIVLDGTNLITAFPL
ncbi:hypothetical protein [Gimesia algae]|uniref:Bacterial EndoU nuclease domain-containing protein n=1 Tax=Gimesia algae TaxID=2527971 RepID=A0A517VN03_9PLAN|nr:hypothetical protein [Gimesia algae]QDT94402.1 hypothetical protein Pan161_60980 [Gimesia algae]